MKNQQHKISRGLLFALLCGALGAGVSATASAQEGPYGAHMVPVDIVITTGWHGDRYYDGHRYWARHDWERRHPPHRRGPPHRDDHRY